MSSYVYIGVGGGKHSRRLAAAFSVEARLFMILRFMIGPASQASCFTAAGDKRQGCSSFRWTPLLYFRSGRLKVPLEGMGGGLHSEKTAPSAILRRSCALFGCPECYKWESVVLAAEYSPLLALSGNVSSYF